GRKGIAVLLVPYPRRRRVEGLLRVARVNAQWVPVPSPDVIRERDRERLLTDLAQPVEASEADQATAAKIAETMDPQAIALALVMARKHGF
ncbi:hypothetical protein ACE40V_24030, partial [Salmonella enterica]|uniref:hypothetical protein n=1 Tax=Salmonella enterica TaxID=28901 RepID=UPI003D27A95F